MLDSKSGVGAKRKHVTTDRSCEKKNTKMLEAGRGVGRWILAK
jgi:hypothetical protein